MELKKGDRICLEKISDKCVINGHPIPDCCRQNDVTFEVIEVSSRRPDGSYRVVIGNHRKGNGPITHGITGCLKVIS